MRQKDKQHLFDSTTRMIPGYKPLALFPTNLSGHTLLTHAHHLVEHLTALMAQLQKLDMERVFHVRYQRSPISEIGLPGGNRLYDTSYVALHKTLSE